MALSFLQSNTDAVDRTVYTFSGESLGAADADRRIIVAVHSRGIGTTRVISSATIGGQSATIVAQNTNTTSNSTTTAFLIATVATGTTGDIVITYDAEMLGCGIGVYRVTDITSSTPDDTAVSSADDPTQSTLDVVAGGFAIACAYVGADDGSYAWTGLSTEDYDTTIEVGRHISAASETFASAQTDLTITADFTGTAQQSVSSGSFASW